MVGISVEFKGVLRLEAVEADSRVHCLPNFSNAKPFFVYMEGAFYSRISERSSHHCASASSNHVSNHPSDATCSYLSQMSSKSFWSTQTFHW
jgi:hypothetical protein